MRISRLHEEREIRGMAFTAFIHNGEYFLVQIEVFQDGMIDCWGLVDLEEFKRKLAEGWVVVAPPEGARVFVHGIGSFQAEKCGWEKTPEDFVREVEDAIAELNGNPTSSERCRHAYERYLAEPTVRNQAELLRAYEAVPSLNRKYILRDQNVKDIPILMIIYGHEEIENWSHLKAARALGMSIPTIRVPKPVDGPGV